SFYNIEGVILTISFLFFNLLAGYLFSRIPGNKDTNQYGSPRGNLRIDSSSLILNLFVKLLRILHLIKQEE
ncbi:MAG: hypothetical protein IKO19_03785, partial [Candidatus Riflebacteria bacterium]|nr:hypothetical protein [Candidatus Riflebacteria bacterium]